jgi:hypothetical protein
MERPMQRTPDWHATDTLIRAQLAMFHRQSDQTDLTADDRRDALELDDRTWAAWTGFMAKGPLPAEPPVPEMLRRLAEAVYYLSAIAERVVGAG